ncbi:MAG: S58 family peptidase, partial [Porticoccaceae bacterium]|nr:S58 family peptidase [Porticoccaceae bacterium]
MASKILTGLIVIFVSMGLSAQEPRARDIGVPFAGQPGPLNSITDVSGVAVGFETIIKDLPDGKAVRTGVTAILP